ncbi:MAG TPA: zinc-dependent alcohol dehydrogenase family protein [Nevskiaceae bacterium]
MRAMILAAVGRPLVERELADPVPGPGEVRVHIEACGVCRTDLHVVDGELPDVCPPVIPGHEIVGRVVAVGPGVDAATMRRRVGVPWLAHVCGHCPYCLGGHENLCDEPQFTGYTRPGGFATDVVADASFCLPLPEDAEATGLAPLLCAGLIGWRSLVMAGDGRRLGLYGFGAAAHILAQVARWQGRRVYAFTRPGDLTAQDFARSLGVEWAGGSDEVPPEQLDAAILFAPVGALVPAALRVVRKGGVVVCGGIHMSDIPAFPYSILWGERRVVSVANLTRRDGHDFLAVAAKVPVHTTAVPYPLARANEALDDLRRGRLTGAAVLVP